VALRAARCTVACAWPTRIVQARPRPAFASLLPAGQARGPRPRPHLRRGAGWRLRGRL